MVRPLRDHCFSSATSRRQHGRWLPGSLAGRQDRLVVILPAFCLQIAPIVPILPTQFTRKCCAVYNLRFELFHSMEEVIGSATARVFQKRFFEISSFFFRGPGSRTSCTE